MWRLGCCIRPLCGKENYGKGHLGTAEPRTCLYPHLLAKEIQLRRVAKHRETL